MNEKPRSAAPSPSAPARAGKSSPSALPARLGHLALWVLGLVGGGVLAVGLLLALGLALAYPNLPDIGGLTDYRPCLLYTSRCV